MVFTVLDRGGLSLSWGLASMVAVELVKATSVDFLALSPDKPIKGALPDEFLDLIMELNALGIMAMDPVVQTKFIQVLSIRWEIVASWLMGVVFLSPSAPVPWCIQRSVSVTFLGVTFVDLVCEGFWVGSFEEFHFFAAEEAWSIVGFCPPISKSVSDQLLILHPQS